MVMGFNYNNVYKIILLKDYNCETAILRVQHYYSLNFSLMAIIIIKKMQQQTGFVPANTTFKVTAEYSLCSNKIERYVDKETDEFLN